MEQGPGYTDFVYHGEDAVIRYLVVTGKELPLDISLVQGKKHISLCRNGGIRFAGEKKAVWQREKEILRQDTLWVEATAITGDDTVPFRFFYTLRQKMLIAGMQELSREEHVEEVALGSTGPLGKAQLYSVPFLNFDYAVAPRIAYGHGLYYFMQFDWYYTDATLFYMVMPEVDQGYTIHNGGESYTFRLEAVPGRGGNTAVKELVHYINVSST